MNNGKTDLRVIPGVGEKTKKYLENIGIYYVEDLVGQDPEIIYQKDCIYQGYQIDRCQLYVYRLAVYFAETEKPEPHKLKWWYWKD